MEKVVKSIRDNNENTNKVRKLSSLTKSNNIKNEKSPLNRSLKLIKRLNIKMDFDESDDEMQDQVVPSILSSLLILHLGLFRKIFDYFIFIFIVYTVFVSPIYLCFWENQTIMKYVEIIIEIFFIIDIFFNFLTSFYDKEENLITDVNIIIKNYLYGGFLLDLIIAFPFELFSIIFPNKLVIYISFSQIIKLSFFNWIKMIRIVKFSKSQTSGRLVNNLKLNENLTLNRILIFSFYFFVLSHMASCFFIYLAYQNLNQINWIAINLDIVESSKFNVYIASLYFNLTTVLTIGYGDITPVNTTEKIYAIFFMCIGSWLYAYAVSSISTIFSEKSSKNVDYLRKLKVLDSICKEYKIPHQLIYKIRKTVLYQCKRNDNDRYNFLDSLPMKIRDLLTIMMFRSNIQDLKFFSHRSTEFVLHVLPMLKFNKIIKGEILISVGDLIEEMYLVLDGYLSLNLGPLYDNLEIWQISKNNHFGDLLMYLNNQSQYEVKCRTICADIFVLKKADFLKIKENYKGDVLSILEKSYKQMELATKSKNSYIRLFEFYDSSKVVKKKMLQINSFLLNQVFDKVFDGKVCFKDANHFLGKLNSKKIKIFLDSLDSRLILHSNNKRLAKSRIINERTKNFKVQINKNINKGYFLNEEKKFDRKSLLTLNNEENKSNREKLKQLEISESDVFLNNSDDYLQDSRNNKVINVLKNSYNRFYRRISRNFDESFFNKKILFQEKRLLNKTKILFNNRINASNFYTNFESKIPKLSKQINTCNFKKSMSHKFKNNEKKLMINEFSIEKANDFKIINTKNKIKFYNLIYEIVEKFSLGNVINSHKINEVEDFSKEIVLKDLKKCDLVELSDDWSIENEKSPSISRFYIERKEILINQKENKQEKFLEKCNYNRLEGILEILEKSKKKI